MSPVSPVSLLLTSAPKTRPPLPEPLSEVDTPSRERGTL